MGQTKLRFLSADDVRRALPMTDAVEAMKHAFVQLSDGRAVVPPRTHIALPQTGGEVLLMPAAAPDDGRMSLKIATLFEGNRARGLPFIQAILVLLDATDGRPLAVMDGASITAIRTGAASGAATDVLARDDAKSVAIIGAGVQGRMLLEAVCIVRPIEQVRVFDTSASAAEAFAGEMSERLGAAVEVSESSRQAVDGADVVCTATTSDVPVFDDGDLAPGVHINAVGSHRPRVREIPAVTVVRARVVVDQVHAALKSGDLIMPIDDGLIDRDHIHAELGEIIAGRKPGRQARDEVTLFKSVGVAIQDLAAARRVFANARRDGLGSELEL